MMKHEVKLQDCNTNRIFFSGYAEDIEENIRHDFIHFDIAGVMNRVLVSTEYRYAFRNIRIDVVDWMLLRSGERVSAHIRRVTDVQSDWMALGILLIESYVQSASCMDEMILVGWDFFKRKIRKPSEKTIQWQERWHKKN